MLLKAVPTYFRGKYQLISGVTFIAFFALVFLVVSIPFSDNVWFSLGPTRAFGYTAVFFVLGLLVVIFSRRIMYATRVRFEMTYLQYILWCLAELIIISLMYVGFSAWGDRSGLIALEDTSFLRLFFGAFVYGLAALIIPNVIACQYFAIIDKNKTIRLMDMVSVVSDEPAKPVDNQKVTLFDNSGSMKLSVSLSHLYYIQSDDNYINVWYTDVKGELRRYMLRCRLKTVEESFRDSPLVRCHRQYIVNLDKVKVVRKDKDGFNLELDNDAIPLIPVTKTYADAVTARLSDR